MLEMALDPRQLEGRRKKVVVVLLMLATALTILSTDLYIPTLPHLPAVFNTTAEWVQLSLGLNIAALGMTQLLIGPLSDRFGRRRLFIMGVAGFVATSIGCALANNIYEFLFWRVLQGGCAAVEAVLVYAILTDIFDEKSRVKILSVYGMIIAIVPAAAPLFGGYLYHWLGWQACFYFIAICAALIFLGMWRTLPETTAKDLHAMRPMRLLKDYWQLLTTPAFMVYTIILALAMGFFFSYLTSGPFIFIDYFGVKTEHFGWYSGIMILSFSAGSWFAGRLAKKLTTPNVLLVGLIGAASGCLLLAAPIFFGVHHLGALTTALCMAAFFLGPIFASAPSMAMEHAPGNAGIASATIGSMQMLGASTASFMVTIFHDGSPRPLAITLAGIIVLGIFCALYGKRVKAL